MRLFNGFKAHSVNYAFQTLQLRYSSILRRLQLKKMALGWTFPRSHDASVAGSFRIFHRPKKSNLSFSRDWNSWGSEKSARSVVACVSAEAWQKLIVPKGNEKECALIKRNQGTRLRCFSDWNPRRSARLFPWCRSSKQRINEPIRFTNYIDKATDFGKIRGQLDAKRASVISAAGDIICSGRLLVKEKLSSLCYDRKSFRG